MSDGLFILGLGHQKCATSWAYRYLASCGDFRSGFAKEYRVWDAIDIPALARNKVPKSLWRRFLKDPQGLGELGLRLRMQKDPDFYFEYFSRLLSAGGVAADMTPSYCGLSVDRLRFIRGQFARRGVQVKTVILLRDPVERVRSVCRSKIQKQNFSEGVPVGCSDLGEAMSTHFQHELCVMRTNYPSTIERARAAFKPSEILIGSQEEVASGELAMNLAHFAGVSHLPHLARQRVNETFMPSAGTEVDDRVYDFYRDVYDYCALEFPEIRELWAYRAA